MASHTCRTVWPAEILLVDFVVWLKLRASSRPRNTETGRRRLGPALATQGQRLAAERRHERDVCKNVSSEPRRLPSAAAIRFGSADGRNSGCGSTTLGVPPTSGDAEIATWLSPGPILATIAALAEITVDDAEYELSAQARVFRVAKRSGSAAAYRR